MLVMKPIIREIKDLLEDSEPGMTVVGCSCDEPFACPIGETLWLDYRRRNPDGLTVPPECPENHPGPELAEYFEHVNGCDDCNEV
jgi:hypothetical protein